MYFTQVTSAWFDVLLKINLRILELERVICKVGKESKEQDVVAKQENVFNFVLYPLHYPCNSYSCYSLRSWCFQWIVVVQYFSNYNYKTDTCDNQETDTCDNQKTDFNFVHNIKIYYFSVHDTKTYNLKINNVRINNTIKKQYTLYIVILTLVSTRVSETFWKQSIPDSCKKNTITYYYIFYS